MTTVVCTKNPAVMASDSQLSDDGMISHTQKIFRSKGLVIGVAGDIVLGLKIMKALDPYGMPTNTEELDLDSSSDISVIILTPTKQILVFDGSLEPIRISLPFYAIGSGREAAMGALYSGSNAQNAIKIAMKVDPDTGGKVKTLKLITARKRRRSK